MKFLQILIFILMFFFKFLIFLYIFYLLYYIHVPVGRKGIHIAGTKYQRNKTCDKVLEKGSEHSPQKFYHWNWQLFFVFYIYIYCDKWILPINLRYQ